MKELIFIRKTIATIMALTILIWAFFQNNIYGKIIIIPFILCSLLLLLENIFLFLNNFKIAHIFNYIFKIIFFISALSFLTYATYYSITHKKYSLIIIVIIFLILLIKLIKKLKC